jgi:plastocyanin
MSGRSHITICVLVCAAVYCAGCGGSPGSGSQAATITVNAQSLAPFSTQIRVNDTVTWVNADTQSHYVVSGTLEMVPVSQRQTRRILINQNNSFTPSSLDANYGDTVEWQNNRSTPYELNIVNQLGTIIAVLDFDQGEIIPVNSFQFAGVYLYEQADITSIRGVLRLFGVGNSDSKFQSQLLATGGTFTRQFSTAGTFNYYITSPLYPNTSFLSGTIVVQ